MIDSDSYRLRSTYGSVVDSLTRHDLVLAVVPLAFLLAFLVVQVLSLSPRVALVAGSAVGAVAIGDGVFRNPPTASR